MVLTVLSEKSSTQPHVGGQLLARLADLHRPGQQEGEGQQHL
jgi:hypothetical protein